MTCPAFRLRVSSSLLYLAICSVSLPLVRASFAYANDVPVDLSTIKRIEIQPERLEINRRRDQPLILVTGYLANGCVVDLTGRAEFKTTDPKVAAYKDGALHATGNGRCELIVHVAAHEVTLP